MIRIFPINGTHVSLRARDYYTNQVTRPVLVINQIQFKRLKILEGTSCCSHPLKTLNFSANTSIQPSETLRFLYSIKMFT